MRVGLLSSRLAAPIGHKAFRVPKAVEALGQDMLNGSKLLTQGRSKQLAHRLRPGRAVRLALNPCVKRGELIGLQPHPDKLPATTRGGPSSFWVNPN